jgi:hypothetical protein
MTNNRPHRMPDDTPDYMAPAWVACMERSITDDEILQTFEDQTDNAKSVLNEQYVLAFIAWANIHVWGHVG